MSQAAPRILIFIHSLHGGGAERVAVDLAGHWVAAGHEVMIVTQAAGEAYAVPPGVQRRVLGTDGAGGGLRGLLANLRRVRALRAVLRDFRPDLVLGIMTTSSILAVLAGWGLPLKVIATEHTHPPSQQISGLWWRLRRWVYPRAARVVALTSGTADWLREHVPGSNLAVIPNPVNWPLPRGTPQLAPPAVPGRRYLLAVGRLHADKGFGVLVDAYAQIAARHAGWDLVILGEGEERTALQARVDGHGLQARVVMPGRAGNVADWYEAADLYVLSSRFEGLSNSLQEAMASGLAAVSFDCDTGPREIIRDGEDGVLVRPVGDAGALAGALDTVMSDDVERRRMAGQALSVRQRFSAQHILSLWRRLFDDVLGRPSKQ